MSYSFEIYGSQIDGARDYQEDAFLITHLGDKNAHGASLVVVTDGMGGHAAGNVASNLAVQAFNRNVTSKFPADDLPQVLRDSVISANNSIRETVAETAALKGMGCTLVCAVVSGESLRWVSVGDSHLYLIRDGSIKKKNADHSYGGFLDRLAAEGKEVEPEAGFSRNMLMSALTGDEIADIDCPETPLELKAGDRIILCSDGLDTLEHDRILEISAASTTPRECVETLLQAVADAGQPRQDNTTVVCVDVAEAGTPATGAAPDIEVEDITEDREARAEREARERAAAAATRQSKPAPGERRGRGGLLATVAVLGLAAIGAGAWYLLGDRQAAPPARDLVAIEDSGEPPPGQASPAEAEPQPEAAAPAEPQPEPGAAAESEPPAAGRLGETFRDRLAGGGQGPVMVWIPAGRFEMGSRRLSAEFDEKPPRQVRVDRLAISRYEITAAEYRRFARATGRRVPDIGDLDPESTPAIFVSWDDALYYTRWLSEQTGERYRLPSEAEWEYAARAGTDTRYWWGNDIGRGKAHCTGCRSGLDPRRPAPVGSFDPNPFGLYDTAGNVAEWVRDCYHDSYEGAPADGGVWEGGDCSVRIVRGGSFSSVPDWLRSTKRDKFASDTRLDTLGFRVAREPD